MSPEPARSGDVPIRVGTAGWSYEDWNAIVYPERPGRGFDRLRLMASLFDTNEINSTFYRIPEPGMTAAWARRVGHNPRFAFTAKLYRGFTHERKLEASDERAFVNAVEPLLDAGRLGSVLAQFPFSFHDTAENRRWLERVLGAFSGLPIAVEFRHASWNSAQTRDLLSRRRAAFVNIDQPALEGNLAPTEHVTAPVAYFRFHGRNAPKWFGPDTSNEERYNYLYTREELDPWLGRIRSAQERLSAEPPVEGLTRGVYVILNNHFRGQAVANALQMENALADRVEAVPESLLRAYPALAGITRTPSAAQRPLF
jgi:uncharacterized protein YecE (DUF72 family)